MMRLPESWIDTRLENICLFNPRLEVDARPSDSTEVTFIPMSAVDDTNGEIIAPETRCYGEVAKGYSFFKSGDVLFAKVAPCMENGKAAVVGPLKNGLGFGSTEFHVIRALGFVLPEYLYYFIRQPAFRKRAKSAYLGTGGLQRVPQKFLERVIVPLPSLAEQARITNLLQHCDSTIKNKKSIIDQIDKIIITIYSELFDKWYSADGLRDPVRISEYIADSQYGISDAMDKAGTHVVLRMNSISTSGWLDLSDLKYATLSKKDAENTQLRDGDLLFNRTNSKELVGKCALWRDVKGAYSFASYLVRLRLKEGMLPEYLWATLNSAYGKYRLLNAAKQAVSMANVSPTDLGRITVPLPPLELQEKFARLVRHIEALRKDMLSNVDKYEELRELITQQALLGDLTASWREQHKQQIEDEAQLRDEQLDKISVRAHSAVVQIPEPTVVMKHTREQVLPARRWLEEELSEFQRRVLGFFRQYDELPLFTEDPDRFAAFCNHKKLVKQLKEFDTSPNRISRTISLLADLGLIAQVVIPKFNQESKELELVKAFRLLRQEEFTRLTDMEKLRGEKEIHYFTVLLDYETSSRVGADGMFQVISITDVNDNDRTDLVDQGTHYSSLSELAADIAAALNVDTDQVELEEDSEVDI